LGVRIQITLKSGAQIEADVSEYSTAASLVDGNLTKLNWTTSSNPAAGLKYVDLNEVAAIVTVRKRTRRWFR
jgi:hypothetical protein